MRYLIIFFSLIHCTLSAQVEYKEYRTVIDGQPVTVLVKDGDTLIIADLEKAVVTAPMEFDYSDDRDRYLKYRRHAAVVYPYAVQAIRLYNQLMIETEGKSEKEKKKVIKNLSKRLEDEFEDPLKNLTRTQGLILTKMIEKHLDQSFYNVVKELKGGFSAFYWNQLSKRFGYDLKDQYRPGADPVMDAVLEDFDIKKDL
ncbi:MAG: DUF4294 domain-containing protein [Saprospiraceae bacterium]|nr:DUF4294 domain-containing protein [Saprospiraceae bacterium]